MPNIIAGRFKTQAEADSALAAAKAAGVQPEDVTTFYVNPPGQHAIYPVGGDSHHDEGTKHAGASATAAAAIGSVAGLALGTATGAAFGEPGFMAAGAIAGAGVGGYVGSLAGGLTGSRGGKPGQATVEEPVAHLAGVVVAVHVGGGVPIDEVVRALRNSGALEVEQTQGEWRDGTWADFDPRRTPDRIA
jgi:hypothetical protein